MDDQNGGGGTGHVARLARHDSDELIGVVVRFTEGQADLPLEISSQDTLLAIKNHIRLLRPALAKNELRLIHGGRLLEDGKRDRLGQKRPAGRVLQVEQANLRKRQKRPGHQRLGSASSFLGYGGRKGDEGSGAEAPTQVKGKGKGKDIPTLDSEGLVVWLHCAVGRALTSEDLLEEKEHETEDQSEPLSPTLPVRGFDRLLEAGFSESDVADLRRQFHQTHGDDLPTSDSTLGLEDNPEARFERARELEEAWIERGGAESNVNGDQEAFLYEDTLKGLLLGFFAFFPLILFFSQRIFSKRVQMFILAGGMVSASFGLLHLLY